MENQPFGRSTDPLDSMGVPPAWHPALQWLTIYGAYFLLIKLIYAFAFPVLTALGFIHSENMSAAYQQFNQFNVMGHIALSLAIIVKVNHTLCRIVFGALLLLDVYSMITTFLLQGH